MASIFGRTDNVKFWLNRFPDWDLERKNKVAGIAAFALAIHMGPRRLELAKLLLDRGSSPISFNSRGSSALMSLCSNEDCDLNVLQFLLRASSCDLVKVQRRARTLKWKIIYSIAKTLVRSKLSNSGLIRALSNQSGAVALHHAVQRGDVDVVNILLSHGADPTIKNDLGKTPLDYCDAFPELRGALKRVIKQRSENKPVT